MWGSDIGGLVLAWRLLSITLRRAVFALASVTLSIAPESYSGISKCAAPSAWSQCGRSPYGVFVLCWRVLSAFCGCLPAVSFWRLCAAYLCAAYTFFIIYLHISKILCTFAPAKVYTGYSLIWLERDTGSVEVSGSRPLYSTKKTKGTNVCYKKRNKPKLDFLKP